MFICCCGDACGFGEAVGICMPGIFIGCVDGCAVGLFIFREGVACGFDIFIPGMVIPGMFPLVRFFAGCLFLVDLRRLLVVLRFAFGLDFDMFMPGMLCMSCCGLAVLPVDESNRPAMITALSPIVRTKAPKPNLFIVPPLSYLRNTK